MPRKIKLNGPVIGDGSTWLYDWFNIPYISASKVSRELDSAQGDEVELYINSGGGSVFAGSEVYTILKEYAGKVTAKITGVAASAASFLAMGADEIKMSPTSSMMIHNAATQTEGDKNAHSSNADSLRSTDVGITNAYRLKTGKSAEELLSLMNKTTWMNAQEAVEFGFADGILFDDDNSLMAVTNSISGEIPLKVEEKLRDVLFNAMLKNGSAIGTNEGANPFEGLDLVALMPQAKEMTPMVNSSEINSAHEQKIDPQMKEDEKPMDFNELKEKHPSLVNDIATQAINAERSRIVALNALASAPGAASFIADAIANGETAADVAMKIVNASIERNKDEAANRVQDAQDSNVNKVAAQQPADQAANEEKETDASVNAMVEHMASLVNKKGGRG